MSSQHKFFLVSNPLFLSFLAKKLHPKKMDEDQMRKNGMSEEQIRDLLQYRRLSAEEKARLAEEEAAKKKAAAAKLKFEKRVGELTTDQETQLVQLNREEAIEWEKLMAAVEEVRRSAPRGFILVESPVDVHPIQPQTVPVTRRPPPADDFNRTVPGGGNSGTRIGAEVRTDSEAAFEAYVDAELRDPSNASDMSWDDPRGEVRPGAPMLSEAERQRRARDRHAQNQAIERMMEEKRINGFTRGSAEE